MPRFFHYSCASCAAIQNLEIDADVSVPPQIDDRCTRCGGEFRPMENPNPLVRRYREDPPQPEPRCGGVFGVVRSNVEIRQSWAHHGAGFVVGDGGEMDAEDLCVTDSPHAFIGDRGTVVTNRVTHYVGSGPANDLPIPQD